MAAIRIEGSPWLPAMQAIYSATEHQPFSVMLSPDICLQSGKVVNGYGLEMNLKRVILSMRHNRRQQDYEYIGQFFHKIHYIW